MLSAYNKNIELVFNLKQDTPRIINADLVRIRQVLTNLVGNAIKFTEKGYVHLQVEPDDTTANGSNIKFTVSDTGIGMNQNHKNTLFDAFTQADTSITRRFGGTGLGLVISRKLTNMMGGTIGFDSTFGEGSTFWFSIPVEQASKTKAGNLPPLAGKNIALIEDHNLCRNSIRSMLESWGCTVTEYNKGDYSKVYLSLSPQDFDACIVSVCRNEIEDAEWNFTIPDKHAVPLLGIISTRSYENLMLFRALGFDDAIFRTSRYSAIQQSLAKLTGIELEKVQEVPDLFHPAHSFDWSGIEVLVVDDNDINLKLAKILLQNNKASVTTALSGEQCIEQINDKRFDLIFMDLQMPGLDGYETTRHIRTMPNGTTPIIVALTANATTDNTARIEASGMNDHLVKPIAERMVNEIIMKWLKHGSSDNNKALSNETNTIIEPFSKNEAKELAAGNDQLANELTSMLIEELPLFRTQIETAMSTHNKTDLKQLIHKIHGSSRCCGTPALRKVANQLEYDIDNNVTEHFEPGVKQVIREIDRLLNTSTDELYL